MGAEIHLESDAVRPLGEQVHALIERVAHQFPAQYVEWDATWYRNRGRLRVLFDTLTPPAVVASGMHALIEETLPELDVMVSNLPIISTLPI